MVDNVLLALYYIPIMQEIGDLVAKSVKGGTAVGGEGKSQSLVALLQQMVDMTDGASSTNV